MKFKCVDDLDKFGFQDAEVRACEMTKEHLKLELDGVIARADNPCNQRYEDFYIATACVRLQKPRILKLFLEGAKYYDADGVLQEEVPDRDIPKEQYSQILKACGQGVVFVLHERAESQGSERCAEIAIDVEDDTYWMLVRYEKSVVEWDRFVAKVETVIEKNFL